MNIGWAAVPLAQQIAVHVANTGSAGGGTSVEAYKKLLWHK
jgi:hypothetical protein